MSFGRDKFFKVVQSGSDFVDILFQHVLWGPLPWDSGDHYSWVCRVDPIGKSRISNNATAGCCLIENDCFEGFAKQWQYFCIRSFDVRADLGVRSMDDVDFLAVTGTADNPPFHMFGRMKRSHPFVDRVDSEAERIITDPGCVVSRCRSSESYPSVHCFVEASTFEERNLSYMRTIFFVDGTQYDFAFGKRVPFSPCFDFCVYNERDPVLDWVVQEDLAYSPQCCVTTRTLVRFRGSRALTFLYVDGDIPEPKGEKKPDPGEVATEDGGPGAEPPENFSDEKNESDVK